MTRHVVHGGWTHDCISCGLNEYEPFFPKECPGHLTVEQRAELKHAFDAGQWARKRRELLRVCAYEVQQGDALYGVPSPEEQVVFSAGPEHVGTVMPVGKGKNATWLLVQSVQNGHFSGIAWDFQKSAWGRDIRYINADDRNSQDWPVGPPPPVPA